MRIRWIYDEAQLWLLEDEYEPLEGRFSKAEVKGFHLVNSVVQRSHLTNFAKFSKVLKLRIKSQVNSGFSYLSLSRASE